MNKRFAYIPITGLVLLTLAGCGITSNANGANSNQVTNSTANTSSPNTVSTSTASTSNAKTASTSTASTSIYTVSNSTAYANEIALIKRKGYDVPGANPNVSIQTSSGDTLTAWIGAAIRSDGHNQYVFFFLNGKYLGTDTAKPSLEIASANTAGTGSIAVTYSVYKSTDSLANPTGTPVTITYTWSGSKLVSNKPYPKQFQAGNTTPLQSNDSSEIAFVKNKGYSVSGSIPNTTFKTASGATLSAWMSVSGSSAHNQFVFFFLNGKYLGTDTAKPSVEITSVKAAGNGIAVTYPVYKKNDSFANPTGTPVTITYTWNGSKLVPNKPYPKQFS